jgi:sugar phosphate isomerase/epimerase
MKLGLHTYSLHLHGMGQNFAATKIVEKAMNIFKLMDYARKVGLDGLHIDPVDCESTDATQLKKIRDAAKDRGLYLEYNFSLAEEFDPRMNNTIEEGIGIAKTLGADLAKISMDIRRPHPLAASRHHPDVMRQLKSVVDRLKLAAPLAEKAGVKLAIENHTESFASEVIWVIDQVNHPFVGACVDTVNAVWVFEDPMYAIEQLVPRAFTNHFKDHRIERNSYGIRVVGVACGDGDIDLKRAYELIRDKSPMKRVNIEVELEWDMEKESLEKAQERELEAVERSIRYCREVLGIK